MLEYVFINFFIYCVHSSFKYTRFFFFKCYFNFTYIYITNLIFRNCLFKIFLFLINTYIFPSVFKLCLLKCVFLFFSFFIKSIYLQSFKGMKKTNTAQIFLVVQILNFVYIFLPGDNTFDANKGINNSQLGQKLYEAGSQGGSFSSFDNTWIVYLDNFYSIYHVTFFFRNGKTNLDIGSFTLSPSNNNYGLTLKSSQRFYILKI